MVLEWGAQSLTPRTRLQQEQRRRAPVPGPGQGLVQGLGGRRTGALLFAQLALNLLLFAGWWHSFYSVQPGSERQEQELEQRGEDRLMSVEISMARPRPQFLLFGDSITQQSFRPGGWGAALADRYSRKADVVLRGYSGYNTRWAMYLLHRIFPPKSEVTPSLVTVFFGANDAALPDRGSQHQHVPLSEYKENLHRIVAHLKGLSDSVLIVLITPPPVDEEGRLAHARVMYGDNAVEIPERTNEFAGLYARACQAVARDENVPVIDLWSAIQAKHNWQEFYLSDGLHLTAAGNSVVFEELVKVLDNPTEGASLGADSLPMDYPEHSHVDPTDPAKTFSDL